MLVQYLRRARADISVSDFSFGGCRVEGAAYLSVPADALLHLAWREVNQALVSAWFSWEKVQRGRESL